jgi:hypothetical protein
MIVYINDLPINDDSNGLYLDEPIEGLDSADIRLSSDVYSGRDGGYTGTPYYGLRLVSLPGHVWAADRQDYITRRRLLLDAIAAGELTLKVWLDSDHHYILHSGKLHKPPQLPFTRTMHKEPFKLDILFGDPIIYDDTSGNALTATVGKYVGGGIAWPLAWPLASAEGTGATTVDNTGLVTIYPVITISGSQTNPIISNERTGEFIQLSGYTAPAGSETVIDLRDRTVTLNGGNVLGKVSSPSHWWGLQPGSNTIKLATSDAADAASAVMTWRNGFMGI